MTQPDDELLMLDQRDEDLEAPRDDAAEQAALADPLDGPPPRQPALRDLDLEADEYDAREQQLVVNLDDDYR